MDKFPILITRNLLILQFFIKHTFSAIFYILRDMIVKKALGLGHIRKIFRLFFPLYINMKLSSIRFVSLRFRGVISDFTRGGNYQFFLDKLHYFIFVLSISIFLSGYLFMAFICFIIGLLSGSLLLLFFFRAFCSR